MRHIEGVEMAAKFSTGTQVRWNEGYVVCAGTVEDVDFNLYGGTVNYYCTVRVTGAAYRPDAPTYATADPGRYIGGIVTESEKVFTAA